MLKSLIKVNFGAFISWFLKNSSSGSNKKGKSGKGKMIAYALLMVYALGVFCWLFVQIFGLLAEPLYYAGCGWLYFVYAFIMSFALMFILSAFAAKNRLYESKDNDLLLSMPIPPSYILGTRMLMLLTINLVTGLMVVGPAIYAWLNAVPFDAATLVSAIVVFIALSLFALAVSSLFGWLLSKASARMRRKALLETVISLAFLAVYFYGYSQINQIISRLIANIDSIAASMSSIAPLYWMGAGATGEFSKLALALAVLIIPFIIVYIILSRTFIKTATAKRGMAKIKYEAKEQKVSSVSRALLKREVGRFFSSSVCIVNNGLSAVFLIVGAVALVIYRNDINSLLAQMPELGQYAPAMCVLAAAMLAGMVVPTSSSVSLEGKNIWIIQSMPVSAAQALVAKLKFSLIMFIPPVLLCMLAVNYVLAPDPQIAVLMVLLPVAMLVVMTEIGLIVNVNHPSLNWTTETQAVKSGISVLISMLYDWGLLAALGIGGYFLLKAGISLEILLMAYLIAMLIAARLLYGHIVTVSASKFSNL